MNLHNTMVVERGSSLHLKSTGKFELYRIYKDSIGSIQYYTRTACNDSVVV